MTFPIVYRKTTMRAEIWLNGQFRSAYVVGQDPDVSNLLTEEQKVEIAKMVREEMEDD